LRTAQDLIGLPVVNLANGEANTEVEQVHFCLTSGQVTGLTTTNGQSYQFFPLDQVDRIGEDAVFLKCGAVESHTPEDVSPVLRGLSVYTRNGSDVGTVEDVVIDPERGQVLGLHISGGLLHDLIDGHRFVPLSQATVGKDTVIVTEEAVQEDEN
jgi:uncharacterized protein YrrD